MCLLVLAHLAHTRLPLVVAANRDEFYARPTAPAQFWEEAPQLLAGRDLKAGGTWLGVTRGGRFAALTNYRDPADHRPHTTSRGHIVRDFLLGPLSAEEYVQAVDGHADEYGGFNLLVGDGTGMWWYSNVRRQAQRLPPGIYGLSNAQLDTPWPKVVRSQQALADILSDERLDPARPDPLFALLADRVIPPDAELPATGIPLELERKLGAVFIAEPRAAEPSTPPLHGTRSSTVLTIDAAGNARFLERSFHPPAQSPASFSECGFSFSLETK